VAEYQRNQRGDYDSLFELVFGARRDCNISGKDAEKYIDGLWAGLCHQADLCKREVVVIERTSLPIKEFATLIHQAVTDAVT
jgi:hypothetical protein